MYISYDKLWKLLIDKKINKTEFSQITGLSSRTVAKLTKNESVTTETLLHICGALNCDIGDIMEVRHEALPLSFYEAYRTGATLLPVDQEDAFSLSAFTYRGKRVLLKKSLNKANKHTVIHCHENSVSWTQLYPAGMWPASVVDTVFDAAFWEPDAICLIVISGKPMYFRNLDEHMFTSVRGVPKFPRHVYVMSEAELKLFEPRHESFPE